MKKNLITKDILISKKENIKTLNDLFSFLKYVKKNESNSYCLKSSLIYIILLAVAEYFSSEFSITESEAAVIVYKFIPEYLSNNNECILDIKNYEDMLYPQYENEFNKTISQEVFEQLQEKAKRLLKNEKEYATEKVVKHWKSIVNGEVPFDYTII